MAASGSLLSRLGTNLSQLAVNLGSAWPNFRSTWSKLMQFWVKLMQYWIQKPYKIIGFTLFFKHFWYVGLHTILKPCWTKLAEIMSHLGSTWAQLERSWAQLCPYSGQLGVTWSYLGTDLGCTGAILVQTRAISETCWVHVRPFFLLLALVCPYVGPTWG